MWRVLQARNLVSIGVDNVFDTDDDAVGDLYHRGRGVLPARQDVRRRPRGRRVRGDRVQGRQRPVGRGAGDGGPGPAGHRPARVRGEPQAPRAYAAIGQTFWASSSPSSNRSPPSCSRARPGRSPAPATNCAGLLGRRRRGRDHSGGTTVVGAPVRHAHRRGRHRHPDRGGDQAGIPRGGGRPAHRAIRHANGRLRQLRRRDAARPTTWWGSAIDESGTSAGGPTWSRPDSARRGSVEPCSDAGLTVDEDSCASVGSGRKRRRHRRGTPRPP